MPVFIHRIQKGGRDCYQAVLVRPTGEILRSPRFINREGVVEWALRALNAQPTSSSKAG